MFERIRKFLGRITGISTPFGGISWSTSGSGNDDKKMPRFKGPISITSPGNDDLIWFLETYSKRVAYFEAYIDASVFTGEQHEFVQREQVPMQKIGSGSFSGTFLPLPNNRQSILAIVFHFTENRVLNPSHGGTGIVTIDVSGFYEITQTRHGGPMTVFHLKEAEASVETKLSALNS